jgi:hypothetical protein
VEVGIKGHGEEKVVASLKMEEETDFFLKNKRRGLT